MKWKAKSLMYVWKAEEGGKKKRAEMDLQSELLSICTFHVHYDNGRDQLVTFLIFNFFSFRTLLSLHYKPPKTYKTIRRWVILSVSLLKTIWGLQECGGFSRPWFWLCVCVRVCVTSEKSSPRINYPIKITSQRVTLDRSRYN